VQGLLCDRNGLAGMSSSILLDENERSCKVY
jgi:hypothetical protein